MRNRSAFLILLFCGGIVLSACNGGGNTGSTTAAPTATPAPANLLDTYVNLLTYQVPDAVTTADENLSQYQLTMILAQSLPITAITVNYYSDAACSSLTVSQAIAGSATLNTGSYITTSASNLALCSAYSYNGDNGCVYAYLNTHSMKFMVTASESQQITSQCLSNPTWYGERLGYYNLSKNWSRNCTTNYNCGFSQNYIMSLN